MIGFVKLRRGILDHVRDGRMSLDEFSVYVLIILKANHHNGSWNGCALALSKEAQKSERWCQRVMASLRKKGYIVGSPSVGRGQYSIKVVKYFHISTDSVKNKVSLQTPYLSEGVHSDTLRPQKASVVTPLQEVIQEQRKEKSRPHNSRSFRPLRSESDQRRIVEARDTRLWKEAEFRREVAVGRGLECSAEFRQHLVEIGKAKAL